MLFKKIVTTFFILLILLKNIIFLGKNWEKLVKEKGGGRKKVHLDLRGGHQNVHVRLPGGREVKILKKQLHSLWIPPFQFLFL